MKHIKDLDEKLTHFDPEAPAQEAERLPTFRKLFLYALGSSTASNGEEAVRMWDVGIKIKNAKVDIDLEDADFNILKSVCEQNPLKWMAYYFAQILFKLKESEVVHK